MPGSSPPAPQSTASRPTRLLTALSIVGAAYGLLLALLTTETRMLIWLAPVLNAVGTNAWNAVAMLAVIMFVTSGTAGRSSGVVMFGFLGGLAVAGPTAGAIVDRTGSYDAVWLGVMAVSLVAGAIMFVTDRHRSSTAR